MKEIEFRVSRSKLPHVSTSVRALINRDGVTLVCGERERTVDWESLWWILDFEGRLGNREQLAVDYLKKTGSCRSLAELGRAAGLHSINGAWKLMNRLIEKGFVENPGPRAGYKLITNGKV